MADFGLAKLNPIDGTNLTTKCGTWGYSAPEMITGTSVSFGYDAKVDSWSLGTILYILYVIFFIQTFMLLASPSMTPSSTRLCGYHPFDSQGTSSNNQVIKAMQTCDFDFQDEAWNSVSTSARDLIQHLLVLDPEQRWDMNQVIHHPWIKVRR